MLLLYFFQRDDDSTHTGNVGFRRVFIYDVEDYSVIPETNTVDVDVTRSKCALAASWRTEAIWGKSPQRYEWTVGLAGQPKGNVLLNVLKEPLWRETSDNNMAIYTAGSSQIHGNVAQSSVHAWVYVCPKLFL